ncbi:hypothetical protein Gohar_017034, partial [Gossypium harknessii]|nr:hypothetical protein [Gossypium harknessii]
ITFGIGSQKKLNGEQPVTCRLILITVWAIWFNHNKQVMEGKHLSSQDICTKISRLVRELNHLDRMLHGFWRGYQDRWFSIRAPSEALSCLQGLSFAKEMGFNFVMVEGDSRSTITKINQEKEDGSRIEAYIKDIKDLTQCAISGRGRSAPDQPWLGHPRANATPVAVFWWD